MVTIYEVLLETYNALLIQRCEFECPCMTLGDSNKLIFDDTKHRAASTTAELLVKLTIRIPVH